ncbi:nitrate reductase [Photobacterium sp. GB-1]|uniref:nitrate reductase n=1 Tax=Photobacterium sp. GB-1 TaxID=2022111 RepID=UPI000D156807|nr:nitrate reductase [Photobacterium sp. GB-1]PSV54003.1 nitrite reductase [Photobacterium sp. GB-1]
MISQGIKSACPYCGVGCGVVTKQSEIIGDVSHPTNRGALCVKGSSLVASMSQPNRLLYPQIKGKVVEWDQATSQIAETISRVIAESGPEAIGMYLSGQLLTEDYYVANKLMKGFIGSSHVDTNSRLCMASAVAAHNRAFGEDIVATNYSDLDNTDLIVLVGSNLVWTHPIVFKRIQQAKKQNPLLKIVVIDPRKTVTAEQADLHLALANDTDIDIYNGLIRYLIENNAVDRDFIAQVTEGFDALQQEVMKDKYSLLEVSKSSGIAIEQLATFYQWMKEAPRAVTVFCQGVNQASCGTDKANSIINSHLVSGKMAKQGCGPFSITGQPNAMGGREVGGLANQLAVHRGFDDDSISQVKAFWQAPNIATKAGHKAVDLFKSVENGDIRVLWIMATNPVISMPDNEQVRRALEKCEYVIVSDITPESDTAAYADCLLPAAAWGEKSGMVTNSERMMSRQRAFTAMPGEVKADWQIICDVAKQLGFSKAFDYQSEADIFREHAALSGINNSTDLLFDISCLALLSDDDYQTWQPQQWPLNSTSNGVFEQHNDLPLFSTPTRKAQLVVTPSASENPSSNVMLAQDASQSIFWLNTGRQRDQWHTMTRTGHVPVLAQSEVEPSLYIHPTSAKHVGLVDGDFVCIESLESYQDLNKHLARVVFDSTLSQQQVFMSMHWAGKYGAKSAINQSVIVACDPISGQPSFKSAQVKLTPISMEFHGVSLGDIPAQLDYEYASFQTYQNEHYQQKGIWRYAGKTCLDKTALLRSLAGSKQQYLLVEQKWGFALVQLAKVINPDIKLNTTAIHLFSDQPINVDMTTLINCVNQPFVMTDVLEALGFQHSKQTLVCSCFQITDLMIEQAIVTNNITSLSDLTKQLKCGTNCGTCLPQVERHFSESQQLIPTVQL